MLALTATRRPFVHIAFDSTRQQYSRCCQSPRSCTLHSAVAAASARHTLLFVAPVWPERSSSAAGVRTSDLIGKLKAKWNVHFLSNSTENQHSRALVAEGVGVHHCPANREAAFEAVLTAVQPQVCIFDRFYGEEAFSFRVQQLLPAALRVLDMQDMHALRQGRMEAHRGGAPLAEVLAHRPTAGSPVLLRELAAIHRCDLTLVCSPVELRLLRDTYGIPAAKLVLAPFFVPPPPAAAELPAFAERRHFVSIGNFKHPPNLDSVQWLANELWDAIRHRLGSDAAELHLYGAYASHAAQRLHDPVRRLFVKGHMPSLAQLGDYRVALAPLRYGAGLKGKVVDSWAHGLPVVTTPVGSEGMHAADYGSSNPVGPSAAASWGGFGSSETADALVTEAASLYSDAAQWAQCQQTGFELLRQCFDREARLQAVEDAIVRRLEGMAAARKTDYVGAALWHHGNRATEYFSRWIELKEKLAAAGEG